jgi:cell division septation protein DedD
LAKSDEGEFELILGNRQLISVFLIVVVLLGVFFSMGYIVGRNSSATVPETAHNNGKTVAVDSPPPDSQPAASSPTPAQEPPARTPETKPAASEPTTTHAEQPPTPASVKPTPVAPAKPKPTAVGPAAFNGEPSSGEYWQVVATSRPDAEIIAEALNKKGFHAQVSPGPREGVFRVLVGPFKDSATQAQTRTKLEAAGFKNPIVRRY